MRPAFVARVLGKFDVQYFSCSQCGLLRTEKPYWLEEAYRSAIAATDTGLLSRNISNRALLEPVLQRLFAGKGKFLDVSGGNGILTRLLRDIGFDCYTTDPYAENLFAFEVLEHIPDPPQFLTDAFSSGDHSSIGCTGWPCGTASHSESSASWRLSAESPLLRRERT